MNSVPLRDVLPWGDAIPSEGRTILICDSVETDGRFLLHTLASQFLSRGGGRVLWVACGARTAQQIALALKKIGCDAASSFLRGKDSSLQIVPFTVEFALQVSSSDHNNHDDMNVDDENESMKCEERFLKGAYRRIKQWTKHPYHSGSQTTDHPLIIVDDVTSLSTLFGHKLTFAFMQQIQALVRTPASPNGCLALLCSHDLDQQQYITATAHQRRNTSVSGGKRGQFIGAGSSRLYHDLSTITSTSASTSTSPSETCLNSLERDANYELVGAQHAWERALVELADGIVDVVPLPSGFTREAQGRLVFTERSGGLGWAPPSSKTAAPAAPHAATATAAGALSTRVVNYSCGDTGVRAIRLRAGS